MKFSCVPGMRHNRYENTLFAIYTVRGDVVLLTDRVGGKTLRVRYTNGTTSNSLCSLYRKGEWWVVDCGRVGGKTLPRTTFRTVYVLIILVGTGTGILQ